MLKFVGKALLIVVILVVTLEGRAASLVTFTVPGAYQTLAVGVNRSATVTGYFLDVNGVDYHGFVRSFAGIITTFDAPGATKKIAPVAINDNGAVTGAFLDATGFSHAFFRTAAGALLPFDAPGVDKTVQYGGTFPTALNASGAVIGNYSATGGIYHGFLRNPDGTFVILDVPGSTGTAPDGINDSGTIAGQYFDGIFVHGFVWTALQSFTTFDVPGASDTFTYAINASGTAAGSYAKTGHNLPYGGFLRAPDGTITTFDVPRRLCPLMGYKRQRRGRRYGGNSGHFRILWICP